MTAKEYLKKACKDAGFSEDYSEMIFRIMPDSSSTYVKAMIEHTKYHVQKALEKAANSDIIIKNRYIHRTKEDKNSILNAYPIENIK